jgi:hypothetical protein
VKTIFFASLLLIPSATWGQDPRPTAIPPGAVQAGQAEAKTERDLPPPVPTKRSLDLLKLQQQADELFKLAQSIPPDIADLRMGLLRKDLTQKLRQIEKLSKQLRGQLSP